MFSSSSFAKASFSVNAFKMAQETDTARSGYWRLFYYNLQEKYELERISEKEVKVEEPIRIRFVKPSRKPLPVTPPQVKLATPGILQVPSKPPILPLILQWQLLSELKFTLSPSHDIVVIPRLWKEAPKSISDGHLLLLLAA